MKRTLQSPRVVNIADLRTLAKRRLPRVVFDYIDGGADDECTLRANRRAYQRVAFNPRYAVDMDECDLSINLLGTRLALPFLLAPIGSSRIFYPRGECVAAGAAGRAGTAYVLSTLSGCRLEDVKAATIGPAWYQLYLVGGHTVAEAAMARAAAAGFSALVVTIDTPVAGLRERDIRNGTVELLARNPSAMLRFTPQLLARPRWLLAFLADGGLMTLPNVIKPDGLPAAYGDVGTMLAQSVVCWSDLAWIRQAWRGPIVVKGVHTCDDAHRAADHGAAALIVSNHGGRQLDSVEGTLTLLPRIVDAVGTRVDVLLDGGIRRGSDIVKALCLGARAVLIGRAYAYGLGAAGGDGVARAIEILRADLTRTLALLGCHRLADLDRSYVSPPRRWLPRDPRPSRKVTATPSTTSVQQPAIRKALS
jgi:isopentenyl diphosphate isomerase/L-lactate dehydrogenase-like FMN-dependent dehydrogenase